MRRLPAIAAVAILASGSAIASLGTAHAATGNAVLKGSIPAWANSKNLVGTADPAVMSDSGSTSAGAMTPRCKRWPRRSPTPAALRTANS
jgi:hypothetical protein